MKTVPTIVLNVLYHLIHSIYTLYELILDWIIVIRCHIRYNKSAAPYHQVEVIDAVRRSLNRIPASISIVVSRRELDNYEFLVNKLGYLIHWSTALNIPHISIFDETGVLVHRRQDVLKNIEKLSVPLLGKCSNGNIRVKIKNGFVEPYYTLQIPGQDDCALRFLSNEDGRLHLIKIARKLCHRYSQKENKSIDDNSIESDNDDESDQRKPIVTLDKMCDAVSADYNFPDPDLIIRTSSSASVFGFCPWQMRLSEIVFLPDHPSLTYVSKIIPSIESRLLFQDFVNSLAKFSLCQQRFGK